MRWQRRISQSGGATLVQVILLMCAGLLGGTAWAATVQYTAQFPVDECTFSSGGRSLYFSIRPGDRLVLAGKENGVDVTVQITGLNQTRSITFATAPSSASCSTVARSWWSSTSRGSTTEDLFPEVLSPE